MADNRPVFFFDIDNCLYPRNANVQEHMADLISKWFVNHLTDLTAEEAHELSRRYYKDYGLALEGLVRHHKVDAMEYNRKVDDALPIEDILQPNPELRAMLERFDPKKVKLWLLTNGYKTHGERVTRRIGVRDLFEGMTFCDYAALPFISKPNPEMYQKAMQEAGIDRVEDCYFVDDSALNVAAAVKMGWTSIQLLEPGLDEPAYRPSPHRISDLDELIDMYPQFVRQA